MRVRILRVYVPAYKDHTFTPALPLVKARHNSGSLAVPIPGFDTKTCEGITLTELALTISFYCVKESKDTKNIRFKQIKKT